MNKYIVRNCPAYSETQGVYWTCYEDNNKLLCQDCTDCVMKQIVDLCKEDLKPVREWQEGDIGFIEYKKDAHLARDIFQLLDIQEVE